MEYVCAICGERGHLFTQCAINDRCFVCGEQKCKCLSGYPVYFNKGALKDFYVNECFICGGGHCHFDCPRNQAQAQLKQNTVQTKDDGTYKFGNTPKQGVSEQKGAMICFVCGSTAHTSQQCTIPNFRLSFYYRTYY